MPRPHRIFPWFLSAMLAVTTPTSEGCKKSAGNPQNQSTTSNPANPQAPAATYKAISRRTVSTRRPDCVISRQSRRASARRLDVSGPDRKRGNMVETEHKP